MPLRFPFSNCYLFFTYQQIDKNPITTDGAILLMKVLDKSDVSAMTDVHLAVSVSDFKRQQVRTNRSHTHVRIHRGWGRGSLPPQKKNNHKNIGFLSNTGLAPLKITNGPSQHSMLGHHRHASHLNGVLLAGQ